MTLEHLRVRVAQAKQLCHDLEYDYEMKLQSLPYSQLEVFQAFASTKLSREFYESLKHRLELREKAINNDPYPEPPLT